MSSDKPEKLDLKGTLDDFRQKRIDDRYLTEVFLKPIAIAPFLKYLDLSYNRISDDGAIELANILKVIILY
jgi:hypothetical protein